MNKIYPLVLAALTTAQAFAQSNATITVTDIGTSLPLENATVLLNGNAQTTDALGQTVFTGLADATYDYTVSATCYIAAGGSVIIAGADAVSALALEPMTTNNVFFYIGSPLALIGATVNLTDGGNYNESFVTWDTFGGEMLGDVPFGEYHYTISIPCYATVTGDVTVDCNNGEGIVVIAEPAQANNVFWFIGSMLAITGATVEITDGADYSVSFVTWDTFGGEMLGDVPFGEYSYTITIPCYETTTGTFTVDCNNGDGIAVLVDPVEIVIDATVGYDGSMLSTSVGPGMSYQWVDCDNNNEPIANATNPFFTPMLSGNYAVVITSGNCSVTSVCTNVVVMGISANENVDALLVQPNPFQDRLTVHTGVQNGSVRVQLCNADGRIVLDETRNGVEMITLPTAQVPSESYLLRVVSNGVSRTLHVVK